MRSFATRVLGAGGWAAAALHAALAVAGPSAHRVAVRGRDARGCGRLVIDARTIPHARDICLRDAFFADLEHRSSEVLPSARGPAPASARAGRRSRGSGRVRNVVLVVDPPQSGARRGLRVFVYRLEGLRLRPRFLGSGFEGFEIERASSGTAGTILLDVRAQTGAKRSLSCRFEEFPLVCVDDQGSDSKEAAR